MSLLAIDDIVVVVVVVEVATATTGVGVDVDGTTDGTVADASPDDAVAGPPAAFSGCC